MAKDQKLVCDSCDQEINTKEKYAIMGSVSGVSFFEKKLWPAKGHERLLYCVNCFKTMAGEEYIKKLGLT